MKTFKEISIESRYDMTSKEKEAWANSEIKFIAKMRDQGARDKYGKTGKDVDKMIKYYKKKLVTWNGKKWGVFFDDGGYGAFDFVLVKPNDKYGMNPVATFNPFTKKIEEI